MRRAAVHACALVLSAVHASALLAQNAPAPAALSMNRADRSVTDVTSDNVPSVDAATAVRPRVRITTGVDRQKTAPWWAAVASIVVPGAGQFALGQQRSVAYLVAEAYLVVQSMSAQRDANRDRDEYRNLAADVARRSFGGSRPVGGWDYYELMEKHLESGVFSKSPSGAVIPETDTSTYNGASWLLARENYWRDPNSPPAVTSPEYQRALAFYTARAIRDEYRWSWRDAQLQQDLYKQTIASSNRSSKRATNLAGLVGANHLASMIDAYVTIRVRRYGGVRVGSIRLDGVETTVQSVGDPAAGRRRVQTTLRFVPAAR
jgi:hypothetical protein